MNRLNYTSNSKKGLAREKNQDRILILDVDKYYLFALLDGVSSFPQSYLFAESIIKRIRSKKDVIDESGCNLDTVLYSANKETLEAGINGSCTVSLLFYSKKTNDTKFINIGDTRIYAFSNQFLESITIDDSLEGQGNIIIRYLGKSDLDINDFKLLSTNNEFDFLICTDGFYKLMESNLKEYFTAINFRNLQNIKRKISYLQRGKNQDDSSYILIKHEI